MQPAKRSIMLISDDEEVRRAVTDSLAAVNDVNLQISAGTLSSVNGAAVRMVEEHDLVVFRLNATTDPAAVAALRSQAGRRGTLLALSDGSISLAEAMELKENGIDEILPFPLSPQLLNRRLLELSGQPTQLPALLHDAGAPRLGRVIPVCPVRGGIGATTIATNLADALQERSGLRRKQARQRVMLIDLDLQFGSVASALDLEASDMLFRMASEGVVPDATFLAQCIQRHASGLDVLTAPDRFAPLEALNRAQVDALIGNLQHSYDFIVVDAPRTLVDWIGPVLTRAHKLLLVTDTTVPCIRQAHRLIEFYTGERLDLPIEMVVNHEKKPMISPRHHVEAQKVLDRPLSHWVADDPRPARIAIDRGELLSRVARGSALSKGIRKLAHAILSEDRTGASAPATTAREG